MWPYDNFGYYNYPYMGGSNFPYYTSSYYWWGTPYGWSDYDLYDYNNNFILDDNEICDLVSDNIYADPGISMSDTQAINVDVKNGVVTLSGMVRNPRSKPLAYSDAYWSSGVVDVVSNIQVQPMQRKQQQQKAGQPGRQAHPPTNQTSHQHPHQSNGVG